jgi:tetratricopeptide (TPR) repeat protein
MTFSRLSIAACIATALAAGCKSSSTKEPPAPEPPKAPEAGAAEAHDVQSDAERQALAEQRRSFLVEQHVATGQALLKEMRLDDAANEAEEALKLDPDSLPAKELRSSALAMKGQPVAEQKTLAEDMAQRQALRVEQMRAEAQDSLRKAKLLIARSDYTGAIAELEIANNLVKYAPFAIDWQGLDVEAKTLLESAQASRIGAEQAAEEARQRKAYEELQSKEQEARDKQAALVAAALDRSISAFRAGDYEESEKLAKQVLDRDPHNSQAAEVRDAAFRAGRTKVREDYVERKLEQFRRWQETLKEMQIPYIDVITEPDPEQWNNLTAMRAKRSGFNISQKVPESERALRPNPSVPCASSSARPRSRCPR